ncbi:MAG: hypothetical protein ACRDKS_06115, partial [Actinomycetota bacterium]
MIGRTGRTLLESAGVGEQPAPALVPPGGMAEAIFLWSNWCRGDANVVIRVTLPNGGGTLDVLPPGRPPCMDRTGASSLSVDIFTSLPQTEVGGARVIAVQQAPTEVAASDDAVWITGQERLIRLDVQGRLVSVFNLQFVDGAFIGGGSDVAIGEGAVWVTCACSSEPDPRYGSTSGGVVRFDPSRNIHT